MPRRDNIRALSTALISSAAVLVLLLGCAKTKKNANAPQVTGSINSVSPAQRASSSGKNRKYKTSRRRNKSLDGNRLISDTTKLSRAFEKNPGNSKLALHYIYRLRSLGMQQQAVSALHKAYQHNPTHPKISSEYGRLLLGTGKAVQAKRVLSRMAPNERTDWQTLSALGTIEARNGQYEKATGYFRKANELEPKRASILNNLALSLALGGKPDEAENLLRNADDSGRFGARLRQNLALVLALQGKYDEAQAMATTDLPPEKAKQNIAYLKRMMNSSGSRSGIELSNQTGNGSGSTMAGRYEDGPATTAATPGENFDQAPTQLTPPLQQ